MEMVLNLAWVLTSLALFLYWAKHRVQDRLPRHMQFLALGMTVLLLLPVISLSDDLQAMQGPSETDTCVRRVLHLDNHQPSTHPASPAFPEPVLDALNFIRTMQEVHIADGPSPSLVHWTQSLDSRPPPRG
jgi:hypothetical protein